MTKLSYKLTRTKSKYRGSNSKTSGLTISTFTLIISIIKMLAYDVTKKKFIGYKQTSLSIIVKIVPVEYI